MSSIPIGALAVVLAVAAEAPPPRHPFLFLTARDVERARAAVREGEPHSSWARAIVASAASERIEDLPPLETAWWAEAREKPWSETYPEIFHHTWAVPARWADLALRSTRGHLLDPSAGLDEKGKLVLLGLASYTFEFRHYDVGLNFAVWGVEALEAYDILCERFDDGERSRMDAFFERMLAAVRENDRFWVEEEPGGALNNHYAWHKLLFAAVGLFYGRHELVEEALRGPKGAYVLMDHGFRDDGLWLEGSIPYQFAATSPLLQMAEILENAGFASRLYDRRSGDGRRIEDAYRALFALLLPDRTLPTIGDCYGLRPHLGKRPDWEVLFRRTGDPRVAWLIRDAGERSPRALFEGSPRLPSSAPPPQSSRLWPEQGYVALRTVEGPEYWSGRGWTLFATYAASPVHANADKLSIILFGDGRLWLPDLEARPSAEHSFSAKVQAELNRETLCHNALVVDGRSQRHPDRRLDLVETSALPEAKRVSIGDLSGRLYEGVRQLRTCIVRDEYVLDVLQVRADSPRELAWTVHVDGRPGASSAGPGAPAELPPGPSWRYLKDPRAVEVPRRFSETFEDGGRTFRLDILLDGPAELLSCGFPLDDGPTPRTVPMRMVRSRAAAARYVAVYRTGAPAREPLEVRAEPDVLESLRVEVRLGPRELRHRIPRLAAESP